MTISHDPAPALYDSQCASQLIGIKDSVHRKWYELTDDKQLKEVEQTLLDKKTADDILEKAKEAYDIGENCAGKPPLMGRMQASLWRLDGTLKTAKRKIVGDREYYVFPSWRASEIITTDINWLANNIHNLGYSFIKSNYRYAGCRLTGEEEDSRNINNGVMGYCEGAATGHPVVLDGGTTVEQPLGSHKTVLKIKEDEGGYDVKINYSEPGGYQSTETRNIRIANWLESFGLDCKTSGFFTACSGNVPDRETLRLFAYLFSSIKDIDLLEPDCAELAMDLAIDKAEKITQEHKEESYRQAPFPKEASDWARKLNCDYSYEKDFREERERERVRNYDRDLECQAGGASYYTSNARTNKKCTAGKLYDINYASDHIKVVRDICEKYDETGDYVSQKHCEKVLDSIEEEMVDAAKQFMDQCGNELLPLAEYLMADLNPKEGVANFNYFAKPIKTVCTYSQSPECAEVLKIMEGRWAEGATQPSLWANDPDIRIEEIVHG